MAQLELNTPDEADWQTFFADIILPIPIPKAFTYRIPRELEKSTKIGTRAIIQFGKKKILTGIISKLHNQPPKEYEAKYILEILDEAPIFSTIQLKLCDWIATYYMCSTGEVINAALPSGLKLSSQSNIQKHPDFDLESNEISLSDKELKLIEVLDHRQTLNYDEVADILQQKSIYPTIKSLLQKDAVLLFEQIKEKFKPKIIQKVRLNPSFLEDASGLDTLFEKLAKRPKQEAILLKYLQEVPVFNHPEKNITGLDKKAFSSSDFSSSALNTLIKNNILENFQEIISRFAHFDHSVVPTSTQFSSEQLRAKNEIISQFELFDSVLLQGITGSGKTEIYIDLIKENLENGNQVLYLVPEIALTTQIVKRLLKVFGGKMGVYHSKYSDNERVEVWNGIISGKFNFIIGVRSAIFLPFDNLGLVIVDEEHDFSYKQFDPAPRYQARDVATVLAKFHHAKALLGTATPAIESYFLAEKKRFGLVKLTERYGNVALPEFKVIDVMKERKRKTMQEDFSPQLVDALKETLATGKQAIIFQNRRGYSPFISCMDCNWIPKCEQCAVSLTYHMYSNQMRCHYCGYQEKPKAACPACGSTKLSTVGFGTEKLEEDLKRIFPSASIKRMDLDTTRSKYSYQSIIDDFENGETDILVGTQMLTKGLDFDNVNLVGILDADRMIHFPDFRSIERTFQLITQVSGRAGRRSEKGVVYLQTAQPDHPLWRKIISYDYHQMYFDELVERQQFNYPPFVRIIRLIVKHKDKSLSDKGARFLANLLAEKVGHSRVNGPVEPVISKIRNQYLREIIIKIERDGINLKAVKSAIYNCLFTIETDKQFKGIRIIPDVDSYG